MRAVTILNSSSLFSSLPLPTIFYLRLPMNYTTSSLTSTAYAVSGGTNFRNKGVNISDLVIRTM